ncbi:MAG: cell division protein FtsA [Desulfuromonadales bacterium]|nr:cell division protein FtsA [Desulfuromonadales bacterium]
MSQRNTDKSDNKDKIIVGLDIGTTKICAVVGKTTEDGTEIIGIGTSPSSGLLDGVVIDIESAAGAIHKAIAEAEQIAGCNINSVIVGITGDHIKGLNSNGVVAIKNLEVSKEDVCRAFDAAMETNIPVNSKVIHNLPQEFIVDEQGGICEPLGMSGIRLEARVHIVTGSAGCVRNIIKACDRASLHVTDIVLGQLATSCAVLTIDEKRLGVCMVDIGGGTTNISMFVDGQVRYTSVIAIGGNQLTDDIAVALHTPLVEAEIIKQKYGCCLSSLVGKDDAIMVPSIDDDIQQDHYRSELCDIIRPRVEEIFTLIKQEIIKSGLQDSIKSGVVITGGASLLEGLPEFAKQILNRPVRIGIPRNIGGLIEVVNSPMYAAGVGLVVYSGRNPAT